MADLWIICKPHWVTGEVFLGDRVQQGKGASELKGGPWRDRSLANPIREELLVRGLWKCRSPKAIPGNKSTTISRGRYLLGVGPSS